MRSGGEAEEAADGAAESEGLLSSNFAAGIVFTAALNAVQDSATEACSECDKYSINF